MSRIGVLLVALLTALVLSAGAGATSAPPWFGIKPLFRTLPIVYVPTNARERTASCSAHARESRGAVREGQRKVAPVACEQPPRVKIRDALPSLVFGP